MKETLLQNMWEMFVNEGKVHPDIDPMVLKSWIRSARYGVDPFQTIGKEVLPDIELCSLRERKKGLIQISLPLMNHLYSLVEGSGFLVILCDENGYLLRAIGDNEPLERAKKIRFVEGANWSEQAVGTNAIGTAITEGKPIQIFSSQHFSRATQPWTCSASPIYDTYGRMIGVINMSGPFEKVHPHTLGMVVSTVKAIENELQLREKTEKNECMKSYLEETINTMNDGIIITDDAGTILKSNDMLLKMLGLHPSKLEGKQISTIIENKTMETFLSTKHEVVDKELKLRIRNHLIQPEVLLNAKPIVRAEHVIGCLFIIREINKVRQFVNKLSGNQAKATFSKIIAQNKTFLSAIEEAKFAAASDATVLIMGESGTGKDLMAQAIHNESSRFGHPFIAINCGSIPRDLLGSELFGYVEGAFTGARKGGSPGKFELADGGTLFLDEIGEMSLEMQVLLLRVLQNREIVRIGGAKVIPINVRIIAATNKNLKEEVLKGSFREDLYFRLNVMPIQIPSLRERRDDIPLLTKYFLDELAINLRKKTPMIPAAIIELLQNYDWPGNVRELQNFLERAMVKSNNCELTVDLFPEEIRGMKGMWSDQPKVLPKKEEIKKQALLESIQIFNGNFSKAAKYLGISRSTLYRQMERYKIRV